MPSLPLREEVRKLSKFAALYVNEMTKISRKIVTIIILGIMIIAVFGYTALIKISTSYGGGVIVDRDADFDWRADEMENILRDYKNDKERLQRDYDAASKDADPSDPSWGENLLREIKFADINIEIYEYAKKNSIYMDSNNFISNSLRGIIEDKISLVYLEDWDIEELTDAQLREKKAIEDRIEGRWKIVEEKDYISYLDYMDELVDQNMGLTQEEKQIQKESNQLRRQLDPTGEIMMATDYYNPLDTSISNIEIMKISLLHNVDYTSSSLWGASNTKALTPSGRLELEDRLAVELYKLERTDFLGQVTGSDKGANIPVEEGQLALSGAFSTGTNLLIVLVLILAGAAVSQELTTGSIKSLIIAPVKRYKIYFAKLASLITVALVSTLFLYVLSMLAYGTFFGFASGENYIYAVKGVVHELNFYIYSLAYVGTLFIDILFYLIFAFMLSTITKYTAAAVGISIATYFAGGFVNLFVNSLGVFTGEWVKFIPFTNLGLSSRLFPASDQLGSIISALGINSSMPSTMFSAIYLAVLALCMIYIGLDSFSRSDIK